MDGESFSLCWPTCHCHLSLCLALLPSLFHLFTFSIYLCPFFIGAADLVDRVSLRELHRRERTKASMRAAGRERSQRV